MTSETFFRFLHPWFLGALVIPVALLAWELARRHRRTPTLLYSDLYMAEGLPRSARQVMNHALPWMRFLALCLGILAMARPQFGRIEYNVNSLGVDIALVLDVSNSMQQNDFNPNRLEAAKQAAIEFVRNRKTDRVSVVVFGGDVGVLLPPTLDMATAEQFLGAIYDGIIDNSATAVGDGLATGVRKLEDSTAKSRVAILLTDGENNTGKLTPRQAAEIARSLDVRVYTIGVGSNVVPRGVDPFGRLVIPRGAGYDAESLRMIAEMTGGKYYHASDTDNLVSIYKEIDTLEKSEIETQESTDVDERFAWYWTPALALLALEFLMRAFWLRRLP